MARNRAAQSSASWGRYFFALATPSISGLAARFLRRVGDVRCGLHGHGRPRRVPAATCSMASNSSRAAGRMPFVAACPPPKPPCAQRRLPLQRLHAAHRYAHHRKEAVQSVPRPPGTANCSCQSRMDKCGKATDCWQRKPCQFSASTSNDKVLRVLSAMPGAVWD